MEEFWLYWLEFNSKSEADQALARLKCFVYSPSHVDRWRRGDGPWCVGFAATRSQFETTLVKAGYDQGTVYYSFEQGEQ